MKHFLVAIALVFVPSASIAQSAQGEAPARAAAPEPLSRHLIMFTRAGPDFANLQQHMEEARAHQALYERLAAEGYTIAGGAFEGQPVLGMTIFAEGIDEARARELIADDELPKLGIVVYEFRTLGVRMGSLKREQSGE